MRPAVLMIEPDDQRRMGLAEGLARHAHEVVPVTDLETGLRYAEGLESSVIVAPVDMVEAADPTARERLFDARRLSLVVLGAPSDDVELASTVRHLPVADTDIEVLVDRIHLVLIGRQLGLEPNVELTSLVGDAVFTPLVTVLRGLHDLRLDARLQVEKTWVDLRGGEVFASAARSVRGAKVIDRLVRRRAGTFSVVLGPPPTTDRFLDVRFDDLIIRALEDAQTELPDRHVFVRVDTGVALQSGELTTGQRALLEVIDDCHTVGDLLDALPGPDGKVAEALAKLVERGAVTLHRPRSHTAVVTDSSADLPMSLIREHDIKVVPLSVKFGDSTFRDGVDILARDFYQLLETEPTDPETEPPTAAEILAAYQQVVEFQDIVSVHISSKLSQTFVQAQHAALEGARTFELPVSRHNVALEVIDGNNVSVGTGLLVLAAARMALRGEKVFTIAQRLRQLAPRIELLFVVDTLDYLVRGGRVGKARALVGKLLNIKPILGAVNGEIDSIDKVRGGRKAHPRIVELMAQRIDPKQPIVACVAHAKAPVWADRLAKLIQERFDVHELIMSDIGPGVGTHAGPGTVGVAFYQPSDEEWALVGPLSGDAAGAP